MARRLGESVFVSGQIRGGDVAAFAAGGIATIVNNRPDGEEPGQPPSAEIESEAKAAGLAYHHIPISGGFSSDAVEALAALMAEAKGGMLLYCKSGTRSAYLWALARAAHGADAEELVSSAALAGYDLQPILPWLRRGA